MCGGRRRRERLLEKGPERSGPGGRRGGREEPRGPGDPVPAAIPGAAHPVSSLVLPSVPRREKKTKPKTPRMGGRKGESNFAHRRAEARGGQDGGALGRKGAFVRLVARGPLEQPFGAGAGVEGTVPGPAESASREAAGGVCGEWGPGEGAFGATEGGG